MTLEEAYRTLNISKNSSEEEIKKVYKELAKKYHPDLYQNNPLAELAEEKLKEINKAYDVLREYYKNKKEEPIIEFIEEYDSLGRVIFLDKFTKIKLTGVIKFQIKEKIFLAEVKNGYLEGNYQVFNSFGKKLSITNYKNGIKDGEFWTFNDDNTAFKTTYVKGIVSKMQVYLTEDQKNFLLYNEVPMNYGKISGAEKKYNIETQQLEDIETVSFPVVLSTEDINIKYFSGERQGNSKLFYENGFEEIKYKNGRINGFSTYYYKNGIIKKNCYKFGKKLENIQIIEYLENLTFKDIKDLRYIKDNKENIITLTENKYIFYRYYKQILDLKVKFAYRIGKVSDKNDLSNIFIEYLDIFKGKFLEWNKKIPLTANNYADIITDNIFSKNRNQSLSTKERAFNFRENEIFNEFNNLKTYVGDISYSNVVDKLKIITNEIESLFKNIFFENEEYETNGTPIILEAKYWIEVFKEAHIKGEIPDNLIEILNVILKDKEEILDLLNLYIGIKYNINFLIEEFLKKTKEKREQEVSEEIIEILNTIFKTDEIKTTKEISKILEVIILPSTDIYQEENLNKIIEKQKTLEKAIKNIKNSSCIFYNFTKKLDVLNEELLKNKNYYQKMVEKKKREDEKRKIEDDIKRKKELKIKKENFIKNLDNMMKYYDKGIYEEKIYNPELDIKNIKILYDIFNDWITLEKNEINLEITKLDKLKKIISENKEKYEKDLKNKNNEIEKRKKEMKESLGYTPYACPLVAGILGYNFSGILLCVVGGVIGLIASPIILNFIKKSYEKEIDKLSSEKYKFQELVRGYKRIISLAEK